MLAETLIKAKKIYVKNHFLTDLQHSPSDLSNLASDDQLAENTQVLSEDFFSIYQHFGVSVGKLAKAFFQEQFATNYDLEGFVMNMALKMTPDLLNNPGIKVLFEPAFCFGRYQTRIDVLIRVGDSVNQ